MSKIFLDDRTGARWVGERVGFASWAIHLVRHGRGLHLRIPEALARRMGLRRGMMMMIRELEGKIVAELISPRREQEEKEEL